jgi:hypothetical protein
MLRDSALLTPNSWSLFISKLVLIVKSSLAASPQFDPASEKDLNYATLKAPLQTRNWVCCVTLV